jgi:hypothetical protein
MFKESSIFVVVALTHSDESDDVVEADFQRTTSLVR